MKNTLAMAIATVLTVAGTAYSEESATNKSSLEMKDNGGYEANRASTHVNANGTAHTMKKNVDVDVDGKGNVTATTNTKQTVDPKGLMNKQTTETKTKVVNGRVVEKEVDAN
jgi:hypothetical protein